MDAKHEGRAHEPAHYGLRPEDFSFDVFQDIERIYMQLMHPEKNGEDLSRFLRTQDPEVFPWLMEFHDGLRLGATYSSHAKLKLRKNKNGAVSVFVDNDIDNLTEEEKEQAARLAAEFHARVDDYFMATQFGEKLD